MNANAKRNLHHKFVNSQCFRLATEPTSFVFFRKDFFQIVSSHLDHHGAELRSLRLDCRLASGNKRSLINGMEALTDQLGIDVFYYYEGIMADTSNLMLFFSNGRQGLGLQEKKAVDLHFLEEEVQSLFRQLSVHTGHMGGFESSPKGSPVFVKSLHW